jgi:Fanconi anemia group M protein
MSGAPLVICDNAEERSGIPQRLRDHGCAVDTRPLDAGDYLVSTAFAVERKAARDFVDSILNRKLYRQLDALAERHEYAALLIEGDSWEGDRRLPSRLLGELYHWISIRPNLSVIYSPSANLTALLLADLARREQLQPFPAPAPTPPAPTKPVRTARDVLLALPGVGPAGARKIAEGFTDIRSLANATEQELKQAVGAARGARLHQLLNEHL